MEKCNFFISNIFFESFFKEGRKEGRKKNFWMKRNISFEYESESINNQNIISK